MKKLYLLRHAQADSHTGVDDKARALTAHGILQAGYVGDYLRDQNITIDSVLCSSARRTKMTFSEIKNSRVTIKKEQFLDKLYNAPAGDLLYALQQAQGDNVLMVAHNPGIHQLANMIVGDSNSQIEQQLMLGYHPATLSVFECDCDAWADIKLQGNSLVSLVQQD